MNKTDWVPCHLILIIIQDSYYEHIMIRYDMILWYHSMVILIIMIVTMSPVLSIS